jgi:DNA-directed RNA polymerase sigma subunit (sigma70/sigma32)
MDYAPPLRWCFVLLDASWMKESFFMMIAPSFVLYDVTLTFEAGQLTGLSPVVLDQDTHQDEQVSQIDLLECYLREIERSPRLSDAQERVLLARVAQGDQQARTRLIESTLSLVVSIARCYQHHVQDHPRLDPLDLIQCGNLALITAVDQYDARSGGASFLLCAIHAIQAAIQEALMDEDGSGHLRAFFAPLPAW